MMFSSQKGPEVASGRWKWQQRTQSPLTTKLLSDVPPEIELSDYRKPLNSGTESPTGLLHGESLKEEPIIDLDLFFERLYSYYCAKGLWCIIIKWIVEIFNVIFMVGFIAFFLLYVDWDALRKAKCGVEAVELGEKPCDLAKEVIKNHPLVPFTITKAIIIGSMVILTFYGLFNFLKFFVQLKNTVKIRHFYYNRLNVTDREIQTTPWPTILEKVIQLQKSQQLCVVKDLSAHDVVMRIMRKENYLIAMLNKGVLALSISSWIPGAGPAVKSRRTGMKNHLILPKTLEWTLDWCIFQSMFDSKFCLRRDFLANPSSLRKRLVFVGIGMLLISPCLVIFMLVYLFLRHAEQFYHHPSTASSRRWSNLSKWILREFNEVDHLFTHRLNNSAVHASNYLKQFPSPLISIIAKFVSFVSGGFAAILIIIAFLDESLLEGHIFGRNLFWYAAVFGTVTAISRAAVTDELQVLDPEGAMSLVVQHTHYMPKRWRGRENTDAVRAEFETLFQYTGMMLLEEMASIFITPYLLMFVVPKRVDDILRFISKFTVYVDGVGDVCSLSFFDFQSHGNKKFGSPFDVERDKRSSQGKMEKSYLSFQSTYPYWEPTSYGQQFISNLRKFREKQTSSETIWEYSSNHPWNLRQRLKDHNDLTQRFFSRDFQHENQGIAPPRHNLGSLWLISPNQRTPPYLLDWYYTTFRFDPVVNSNDFHPSTSEAIPNPSADNMWQSQNKQLSDIVDDENWEPQFSDRLHSHLEASTSNRLFKDDVLQHPGSQHQNIGHWWDRPGPQSSAPHASFMEPPAFGIQDLNFHHDDVSVRSEEEQGGPSVHSNAWKNPPSLSRTMYMDDSDSDEALNLHFTEESSKSFGQSTNPNSLPSISIPEISVTNFSSSLPLLIKPRKISVTAQARPRMGSSRPFTISATALLLFLCLSFFSPSSPWPLGRQSPRFLGQFAAQNDPARAAYQYEERYFRQPLDHFSFSDLPTFDQRYLIAGTGAWSRPAGPIFFYCGNEGDIEWFAANTGFVWDIAPRFSALVVFAEHRYYGKSMPYGSKEEAYKNAASLSHLTAEQALADFSALLTDLKHNMSSEDSPVVLFGGSYGGMLAAWMRLKYPHIAIGALASSAPILQFEDIVPPDMFYNIVSNDFKRESLSCFKTIKESWDVVEAQGMDNDGLVKLSRNFRMCRNLNNSVQLSDWLSSAYSYLAMVDYPYPSEFLMPLPANPIKEVCRKMDSYPDGASILERIFAGVSIYYNYTGNVNCFDLEDDPHGMNGWNWQACTEMVMPMSSSKENSMFPEYDFDYAAYKDGCLQYYGVRPRPRWITTEFGGHDIKTVLKKFGSNIIFSNGLLDPWSGGSVLHNISDSIVALVTELGAHHIDLRASTAEDPEWLVEQRNTEINIIRDASAKCNNRRAKRLKQMWKLGESFPSPLTRSLSRDESYLLRDSDLGFSLFASAVEMASPTAGATPSSRAVGALKTPASRGTSLGDDAIWKRLREAGLDEDSVKRRDKAALIAYITKLESEIYDCQHQMGLLILERKELISKYEQIKAASDSAEIAYKREEAKRSSALAEARKREQNLEKLLGIQKECVANIEKAMHDNLVEFAERKLAYESKIAEARSKMEAAQEKFDEAEKKLLVAASLQAEANRTQNAALRTLEDVEAREDELRRRIAAFKSECEAKESEISIKRQALYESQKTLHLQQERLMEGQTLLNQRDGYIFERTKELSGLEKELEEAKAIFEEESRALKAERSSFNLEVAALATREEAIVKREAMLDKRECELLILQEKIVCKEQDEIKRIKEEHQTLLEKRKGELENEIEQKHIALKNELDARKAACEAREADLCSREIALQEREHALKLQLSILSEKQEDIASRLRLLDEKEQNIIFSRSEAESEIQKLQKERECILNMKQDLEKTKATLEDEKQEILIFEQKIELTLEERNKLIILENQLKEEIDSLRAQKLALVDEADRLKAEKHKFETEWELIDVKKEDLKKDAERIEEERKAVAQYLKNERDSIKLEKANLDNQFKNDIERLSREREELISEINCQHSIWFSKIQREREDFIRDIHIQRDELENSINKRREEIETYLREREEAFELEKAKELLDINSQKEMIAKQLEHVALEMQKLDAERMEISKDREQREKEWSEIKRSTEDLDYQCEKLQKQRELLHAERKEINQQIQHLKYLENLHIESENRALSEVQLNESKTPIRKTCQCNDLENAPIITSSMMALSQGRANASKNFTPDTKSWIRKCTEVIFKHSPEKDSDTSHEKNAGTKMLSNFRDSRSPDSNVQLHENLVKDQKVSIQEVDDCQDLAVTPKETKSNRHNNAQETEIECVRGEHNISDSRPAEGAQSPSAVGGIGNQSSQPLEVSGQKSRTIFTSVNSWLLGRKRSNDMVDHDHADSQSERVQKQPKRSCQNGNFDVEGDFSNCLVEPQPCVGDKCEELQAVFNGHEHDNAEVSNSEPTDLFQIKSAVSNFGIVENGKSYKSFEHSLSGDVAVLTSKDANGMSTKDEDVLIEKDLAEKPSEEANVSSSDIFTEDNVTPKKQDRYNQDADELEDEDEDEDGGRMSVKEKLWNFLIT
ncbi:Peptidase S28 [Canna indica]|uniref:Autophagy-related protein 9 n=1 Tax=Canna indica TaxID=4628 RepID=A0AAQ3KZQ9_9LILI|nr:Peptidase S28 [Canna indica]